MAEAAFLIVPITSLYPDICVLSWEEKFKDTLDTLYIHVKTFPFMLHLYPKRSFCPIVWYVSTLSRSRAVYANNMALRIGQGQIGLSLPLY